MSGYFERLVQRAQGGAALAGAPVIRPLPAIYQGATGEQVATDASLEVEAETFASEGMAPPAQYAAIDRPEAMPTAIPPVREPRMEREGGIRQKDGPPVFVEQRNPSPPPEQRAVTMQRDGQAKEGTPSSAAQSRPKRAAPAAPMPIEVRNFMSIEQIVDAMESTPPAQSAAATALWPGDPPARGDAQFPPPSVSIGRIDIVVAPPPLPATRTEATRGFQSYARLRRGLAR